LRVKGVLAQSAIGHLSKRPNETKADARVESFTLHPLASACHKSKLSITVFPENRQAKKVAIFKSYLLKSGKFPGCSNWHAIFNWAPLTSSWNSG
jgi:hypothetical protein